MGSSAQSPGVDWQKKAIEHVPPDVGHVFLSKRGSSQPGREAIFRDWGYRLFSPMEGRFTSPYGKRGGGFHAGIDIAPPVPGTIGFRVYSVFAGTVQRSITTRKPQQRDRTNELAPHRTGNGVIIQNVGPGSSCDGEWQLYGHMTPVVANGQFVPAGTLIGWGDLSGVQSGPHVHYEEWDNCSTLSRQSTRDPLQTFKKFGVRPGDKICETVLVSDQIRLKVAGYYTGPLDGAGSQTWYAAVKRYQMDSGLVGDGHFGELSRATYDSKYQSQWEELQKRLVLLKRPNGTPFYTGAIDGIAGPKHYAAVTDFQRQCGLLDDGIWGQKSESAYHGILAAQGTSS